MKKRFSRTSPMVFKCRSTRLGALIDGKIREEDAVTQQIECDIDFASLEDGAIILYYRPGFPKNRRLGKLVRLPNDDDHEYDGFRGPVSSSFFTVFLSILNYGALNDLRELFQPRNKSFF